MVMLYRPERIGTAFLRRIAARTPTFRPRAARTGDEGRQLAVSLPRVPVPAGARAAVPACPWPARGALWIRDNMSAILKDQPAAASTIRPDLPHDLETVLNRCLRKDPNRRFQHMADVKISLLPGTENGRDAFFSPDRQWVGFFADGELKKISVQ